MCLHILGVPKKIILFRPVEIVDESSINVYYDLVSISLILMRQCLVVSEIWIRFSSLGISAAQTETIC